MKIIIYILFIYLISISNSLPHFIYDGIESYRQCFDDKDEISLTIYGTLIGRIDQGNITIEDFSLKRMGIFKCFFSENENSINEKRKHKIVCSISGSFPRFGYIIEEPKVHGFDFMNEDGKSSWPKIVEKKTFLIGECGSKIEIDDEPILFASSSSNYSNPINKVRKDIVDEVLNNLPKRNITDEIKMSIAMKNLKNKYNLNETECAYLVYKWISQNIDYDCYGLNRYEESHGEASTYQNGKGVCSGMSYIFRTFCRFLGLEAEYIIGYTKSNNISKASSNDHAWNSVKIDSIYYLIDSTWGSGSCVGDEYTKNFNDLYFCLDPKIFGRSHLPVEAKWQLLPNIITYEQFENQAILSEDFYLFGLETLSPDAKIITVEEKGKISLTYNESINNLYIICYLYYEKDNKQVQEENTYLWSKEKGNIDINFYVNYQTIYKFCIYVGHMDEEDTCPRAALIYLNSTKKANIPQYFPKEYNLGGFIKLIQPLNGSLIKGELVDFKVKTNKLDNLYISSGTNIIRKLEKENDEIFIAESVYIFGDKLYLLANNGTSFNGLLFYKIENNLKLTEEPSFPEINYYNLPNVLYSPLSNILKKGNTYIFKIKCKTAREMKIFDGKIYFKLEKKGDIFNGKFHISNSASNVSVLAKIDDGSDKDYKIYTYKTKLIDNYEKIRSILVYVVFGLMSISIAVLILFIYSFSKKKHVNYLSYEEIKSDYIKI